jgi:hypothetical protein
MESLSGPISDRLRKIFKNDDPAWDPKRISPTPSPDAIRHAEGHGMGNGVGRDGTNG